MLYGFAANSELFLDDQGVVGFWTRLLAADFESANTPFNDAAGAPGDFRVNSKALFQMFSLCLRNAPERLPVQLQKIVKSGSLKQMHYEAS